MNQARNFLSIKVRVLAVNAEILKYENSLTWLGMKIRFELISCFVLILGENGCLLAKNKLCTTINNNSEK